MKGELAATASVLFQKQRFSAGFRAIPVARGPRIGYLPGMTATALPYEFPIDVAQDDIDFMGHVNNASYLKWVQAAVISHSGAFSDFSSPRSGASLFSSCHTSSVKNGMMGCKSRNSASSAWASTR